MEHTDLEFQEAKEEVKRDGRHDDVGKKGPSGVQENEVGKLHKASGIPMPLAVGVKKTDPVKQSEKTDTLATTETGVNVGTQDDIRRNVSTDFVNEIEPLPLSRTNQNQSANHPSIPGAYSVAPFSTATQSASGAAHVLSQINDERSQADHDGDNNMVSLPATLAPVEEDPEQGVRSEAVTRLAEQEEPPLVVEGKVEAEPSSWRHFAVGTVVAVLIAIVVFLALGLAGIFEGSLQEPLSQSVDVTLGANATIDGQTNTTTPPRPNSLLEQIREEGVLTCSYLMIPGMMYKEAETNEVLGFNSVWCKAVAAAIFGPHNYSKHIQYFDHIPFANENHTVRHVNAISTTHTMEREVYEINRGMGRSFTSPYLYDGTRVAGLPFFVDCAENKGFLHVDECEDLMLCVSRDSTHHSFALKVLPERRILATDSPIGLLQKFIAGECNVLLFEAVGETVLRMFGYKGDYAIGKKLFTHEPLAVVTPAGEPRFEDFVNAVLHALLAAEQHNITQATADQFPQTGVVFGEDYKDMFRNAIAVVGNFGEIHERELNASVPRERINMINDGGSGLMYSHPFGKISERMRVDSVGPILHRVLQRQRLVCGILPGRPGFAVATEDDGHMGLDVEFCRAVAAGLFGGYKDLELVELANPAEGFQLLSSGDLDIIAGVPWTLENDVNERTTGLGFAFTRPYYYSVSTRRHGQDDNLCLATAEDDHDWSSLVYWVVMATIYAEEEGIRQDSFHEMPLVYVYGEPVSRLFRDAILAVGNYDEIYNRSLGALIPRSGRNLLNVGPSHGPQQWPLPGLM